jgi:AAA family ATP:ADP antiporter
VREPLILLQGSAEMKLYLRAAQAVLMVGVVHLYGELARRVGRSKLLATVFLFFISNLFVFAFLAREDVPIGLPFFLWVGVFSYTVVAQFWALAADLYTEEQGKRLFPIIGGGSSIGAVCGGLLAKSLVPYGPHVLMGTSAMMLLVVVGLIAWINHRNNGIALVHHHDEPLADESPWHLLAHDRYLWLIGGLVVFLNWVNSSGEYLLDRTILVAAKTASVPQDQFIGDFKATYYAWYNAIGVVLQLFLVSRILKLVGVRRALLFLPAFALIAYGSAVFFPVLAVMRLVKIGENAMQYSLQDTTRHALFLTATRVEKFVGKTAVDTIAVRVGAILSAATVFVGKHFAWPLWAFAAIDVVLALIWIGFAFAIGREHLRRTKS